MTFKKKKNDKNYGSLIMGEPVIRCIRNIVSCEIKLFEIFEISKYKRYSIRGNELVIIINHNIR